MKYNKGFTLIELLVVIAIIGLLSAIVLVVLSGTRNKGNDAAVKENLVNIRPMADLYFDNSNYSYGTFAAATCPTTVQTGNMFSTPGIINALNSAVAAGTNGSRCVAAGNNYAIAVGMKTAGQSWCIDNSGASRQYAGTPTAAITGTTCN